MVLVNAQAGLWGPVLGTLVGVVVGASLTWAVGWWQSARALQREAAGKAAVAIALISDLFFDYAVLGEVDLTPSRAGAKGGSGLYGMNARWETIRPSLSVVAVSDPDPGIRQMAGELGRAVSLHARAADDQRDSLYRGSTEDEKRQAFKKLAKDQDRAMSLLHNLEKSNIGRTPGARSRSDELARLRADTRHSQSDPVDS